VNTPCEAIVLFQYELMICDRPVPDIWFDCDALCSLLLTKFCVWNFVCSHRSKICLTNVVIRQTAQFPPHLSFRNRVFLFFQFDFEDWHMLLVLRVWDVILP
jgi:hypothetical protein